MVSVAAVSEVLRAAGLHGPILDLVEDRLRLAAASDQATVTARQLPTISAVARQFHKDSLMRSKIVGHQIDDPSWNMLLALFADAHDGRSTTTTGAIYASGVAPTTALRYLNRLAADDLVSRSDDCTDARRTIVAPTSAAMTKVEEMVRRFCVAAPPP